MPHTPKPNMMPQEIEVWFVIPALRKQLATSLKEKCGLKQKQIAKCLGVTEPAVSQYLSSKRANEVTLPEDVLEYIDNSVETIAKTGNVMPDLVHMLRMDSIKHMICNLHRKSDEKLKDCNICFGEELVQVDCNTSGESNE